jgi:hypothetical protein
MKLNETHRWVERFACDFGDGEETSLSPRWLTLQTFIIYKYCIYESGSKSFWQVVGY